MRRPELLQDLVTKKLIELRLARGLSIAELSRQCGLSEKQLNAVEHDYDYPADYIRILAEFYKVNILDIL